jgi:hypothetical protein
MSKLKAFVRIDGSGRVVAGSLILQASKPRVGNWREIDSELCCNPTTSTTTTSLSCYQDVQKFDIYNGGYFIQVNPGGTTALILDIAKLPGLPPLGGYTWDQAQTAAAANTSGGYTDWRVPTAAEFQIVGDSMWNGQLPPLDANQYSIFWTVDEVNSTTGMSFVLGDGTAVGPQYTDYNKPTPYPKSDANIFVICVRTDVCS